MKVTIKNLPAEIILDETGDMWIGKPSIEGQYKTLWTNPEKVKVG